MTKKKQPQQKLRPAGEANAPNEPPVPSMRVRSLITVGLMVHAFLLLVSYGSVVEPSDVQSRLRTFFSWYLNPLHLNVDGRRIFFLHHGEETAARQFQVRALPTGSNDDPSSETGWQPVPPVGWVGGEQRKRYQYWAAATATLAQQQEVGLAGTLARRAVINEDTRAIRLVLLSNPLTEQIPAFEREIYRAAVVREDDQVRFVQLNESRENAVAVEPTARKKASTSDSEDGTIDRQTNSPRAFRPESDE